MKTTYVPFLSLEPQHRHEKMLDALDALRSAATLIGSRSIVLAYGSSSYGFNPSKSGKLDDIDLFVTVPSRIRYEGFILESERVFGCKLDCEQSHFEALMSGGCDICRMYGEFEGIRVGFRIIHGHSFIEACTTEHGSVALFRNLALVGQSRIIRDHEWSFPQRRYIGVEYFQEPGMIGSKESLIVPQYVFPPDFTRLGVLGRKFLTCTPVYDPNKTAAGSLDRLWARFVALSRRFAPTITPDEIIDSIFRSDRFSPAFRDTLCQKIHRLSANVA